jgi:peptide/nickel transport system substrate-binding protein
MARPSGWTLRAAFQTDIDYVDPALANYASTWQLEYATCLKLVNYPDGSGPRSAALVPEAAPWPRVSADGRMFTFQIRADFTRFSNGRRVTAVSFARAFARAASRRMTSRARALIAEIVGAEAVSEGHADRIRGVQASGTMLTIRLTKPVGDFLARLALPFFCAVPRNLPIAPGGVPAPVPSAGPYRISKWVKNTVVVLERNPFYRGSRPHRPQRVVVDVGATPAEGVRNVKSGATDWFSPSEATMTSWAILTPTPNMHWLAFNVKRGPFQSVRLRRAVAHVLDRRSLANAAGRQWGEPTDHLSSPVLPHGSPSPFFSPSGDAAGLTRARELAQGLVPASVKLFAPRRTPWREIAGLITSQLAQIGIAVQTRFEPVLECSDREEFDLAIDSLVASYLDRATNFAELLRPHGRGLGCYDAEMRAPPAPWAARFRAADRLRRARRGEALAGLERRIGTEFVPATGLFARSSPQVFSTRIGCRRPHRVYQVDIAALCLRR